jgi:calcineurin-like phosphoesterase family protein
MLCVKPIKFDHNATRKSFFWGCTHTYHDPHWPIPLWRMRGYSSVEEHAQGIKEKINSTCSTTDTLFLLGDGFLTSSPEQVEEFLLGLNPQIQYIWGNHESSITRLYRKYRDTLYGQSIVLSENTEIYPLKWKNLTFWGNYLEININGQCLVLSHYPFKVFNNSKQNYFALHSHCHNSLASSSIDAQEGKILDVGVDAFLDGPVSFDKIKEIMNKKPNKSFDKHH